MLRNHYTTALRYLLKNPLYAGINIFGLSIGLTCTLLILLFIKNEFSYDRFHDKKEDIYRLVFELSTKGREIHTPQMVPPVGPDMVMEFPEVVSSVRFTQPEEGFLGYDESTFNIEKLCYSDSNLFRMFSFELLTGDPERSLAAPYSLVITEDLARRIFGDENPIGKMVRWNNRDDLTVTGVMQRLPTNSHLKFDALISMSTHYRSNRHHMDWNGGMRYYHYLEFHV